MPNLNNYALTWDEEKPNLGEGVSRTSKSAPLYEVHVVFPGNKPMKEWLRAANKREAAKFATNRHPRALSVTVIGRV